jgi:hypothetical protein
MTEDARRGAYLLDAYFQDSSDSHTSWVSVVLDFKKSEAAELVEQPRDSLQRLLDGSNEEELVERLFGAVPFESYRPRTENLTARAWITEVVFLLAGGAPRDVDSVVGAQRRAVSIARAVLAGEKDVLVGARDLCGLRFKADVPHDDADFNCFVLIESETDALPLADERHRWSAAALLRLDPDITRATKWATEIGWQAFRNVVRRFDRAG